MIENIENKEQNTATPNPKPKRVLTIQDISCLGRCSITIALPIISALGSETVILPTAILSTHTIFPGFTFRDLTDQIEPITSHWKSQDVEFDAIYTGYLGTIEQIDLVKGIFKDFGGSGSGSSVKSGNSVSSGSSSGSACALKVVDPVMGDRGKLYPGFDMDYVKKNTELCACADIIVPNMTEASLMTGLEYREEHDEIYIKEMLAALEELGARINVLTGVSLSPGKTGIMGHDSITGEYYLYQNDKVDAVFHGTGDLFSSTCIGEMMRGKTWQEAMTLAADYTALTIDATMKDPARKWYGVNFESTIPQLIEMSK
ncbi:MAG: bifunctional hydroxymethylpyrimidine kinase/phosphomethylpyrimidine kinase [Mogibacterium sp.]|nr:bifunctional hydroxymethylpyrimidine kinase/phosphomethylpyrimidine kinase [Mogibacterium sp.]